MPKSPIPTGGSRTPDLTIFVCTFNSAATLETCLRSISASEPSNPVVVIDQNSQDSSVDIAASWGAEVHRQGVGLGFARQLCFELAETSYLAFVDSDEEIVDHAFFRKAVRILEDPLVGAVAGMALGHRFAYGLPMGLLVLRSKDFHGKIIPPQVNAREEYYVSRRLRFLGQRAVFLPNVMIHRSQFRKYKAEWEGANTRIVGGPSIRELLFILKVLLLQSLNSKKIADVLYVPIFYVKFLRGFVQPTRWRELRQEL